MGRSMRCLVMFLFLTSLVGVMSIIPQEAAHAKTLAVLSVEEGIDVWMQYPAPFGGQGVNQSADLVVPEQTLTLTAQVVNDYSPLADANVTFEIRDNSMSLLKVLKSVTNASGTASSVYVMPWLTVNPESLFGLWQVKALTNATGVWLTDTLVFRYDYLVHVWSLSTNKMQYEHLETVKATLVFGTLAQQIRDVWVTTSLQDSLHVPFGTNVIMKTVGGAAFSAYRNYTSVASIRVPYWVYPGWATVHASALDKQPSEGGTAVTPEAKTLIWILGSVRTEPTADFSFTPENPRARQAIFFNATASISGWNLSDSTPTQIVNYGWSFGDGSINNTGTSPVTTHVYRNVGSFQVTLTVVDDEGQSDSMIQTVTVWAVTDISVKNVTTSKTIVGRGFEASIRVIVQNIGDLAETFSVAVYADLHANVTGDEITVGTQTTLLPSGNSATLIFTFRTQEVAKGNYIITARAFPLPNETDTANNTLSGAWIIVSIIGDITGLGGVPDGKVDMLDLAIFVKSYGVNFPDPRYNPNYDLNSDGKIDIIDLAIMVRQYGKIDP